MNKNYKMENKKHNCTAQNKEFKFKNRFLDSILNISRSFFFVNNNVLLDHLGIASFNRKHNRRTNSTFYKIYKIRQMLGQKIINSLQENSFVNL